ncbi:endo alpha-1,4 polygalactosaminidase precusor precursor [Photobacterium aphoticum]|uniref:Endo alpha-1,4 polygalactosaminidase precusor n=1 Tax=Photobacterium aphoticum TaxID=754436 RepID=A0A090QWK5_9GAMM|nr:endo alpha-1,4 polygalactosaminidase precusor precursor [Photobacterium aphoticum]
MDTPPDTSLPDTGAVDPISIDPESLSPITTGNWYRPAVMATWQWQLNGTVNTTYDVAMYDIDLFDSSETLIQDLQAKDIKVICYFSAGSYEEWRPDATAFESAELGNALDGWPGGAVVRYSLFQCVTDHERAVRFGGAKRV